MKRTIPLYSSLAVSFLACHLAREAVLPTDIYEWALEGKLPYLTAFVDMDKYLGSPSNACPMSSRFLFRPIRVIGALQLEAAAGSIAQTIGLRIHSVNFYAIACRYLKELSLPVEKILPRACQLYQWSMPADLWLSSNIHRLPTRVCVMSILIATIRILYNINGQGTWEMSLSNLSKTSSDNRDSFSSPKFGKSDVDYNECYSSTDSTHVKGWSFIQDSDFNTKELLHVLEVAYDKINKAQDYAEDLPAYLKYCKDVVFAGRTTTFEEERLIEKLWDTFEKQEDNDLQDELKIEDLESKLKRPRDGVPTSTSLDSKKPREGSEDRLYSNMGIRSNKDGFVINSAGIMRSCSTASTDAALQKMKLNMEKNGFHYLPPRTKQWMGGYLHYMRQKAADGRLIYVAHADYYILLRACARLARVDVRMMHVGVLKLEKRLDWIERRIDNSFNSLPELLDNRRKDDNEIL